MTTLPPRPTFARFRRPRRWLAHALLAGTAWALPTREFPPPAAPGAQGSNLVAGPEGTLHLTWTEPSGPPGERAVRHATLAPAASAWSAPRTIVAGPRLLANWADFPSLAAGGDGALTAQWYERTAPDAGAYAGWSSRSEDGGRSWRAPAPLGHEFVVLAPLDGGRTLAAWLEGTGHHEGHGAQTPGGGTGPAMRLRARLLAPGGESLGDWTVDPDVCTCCQNTAALVPGGRVFVAYRGHSPGEVRDPRYAIFDAASATWSAPRPLHEDGWRIAACPVNGPAADSHGAQLAVAWYTAAHERPRVRARLSADGGRTLGPPVDLDLGRPLGRVETVALGDDSAVILWLENDPEARAAGLHARRVFGDGRMSAAVRLAGSSPARASGFPRAARRPGGSVVMSWTEPGEPSRVRTLEFDPRALAPPPRAVTLSPR